MLQNKTFKCWMFESMSNFLISWRESSVLSDSIKGSLLTASPKSSISCNPVSGGAPRTGRTLSGFRMLGRSSVVSKTKPSKNAYMVSMNVLDNLATSAGGIFLDFFLERSGFEPVNAGEWVESGATPILYAAIVKCFWKSSNREGKDVAVSSSGPTVHVSRR